MSTRNRPAFVQRSLAFLAEQSFTGNLLVVDASDDVQFKATETVLARHSQMNVTHFRPERRGNNWDETARGLRTINAKHVMWHHDDDFYFLDAIDQSLAALEKDSSLVSVHGREIFLFAQRREKGLGIELTPKPRFSYLENSSLARVSDAMARYCHLFFAVMARECFIDACERTSRHLDQGWFDQYAWSLLVAGRGKSLALECFYGVRQKHGSNHESRLDPYLHWPLLVASPKFSDTYMNFRTCLLEAFSGASPDKALWEGAIDHGLIELIGRQYGAGPLPEGGDQTLVRRCQTPGTPESSRIASVVRAIARNPQTL